MCGVGRLLARPRIGAQFKAMELLKDKRMTAKQVAMRSGVSERHARRLRNQMEVEK